MKVFIVTKQPFPRGMAATSRIICYAKGLLAAGMDCEVVVARRTEPASAAVLNPQASGTYEDIPYRYVPADTVRSAGFLRRRVDDFMDYARTVAFVRRAAGAGDAVLCYFQGLVFTSAMLFLGKRRGVRFVKELCEYPYVTSGFHFEDRLASRIELKLLFPRFDGFIAISESLRKVALHYGSADSVTVKVPILADTDDNATAATVVWPRPYIFHAGTMYERKDAFTSTMKAFVAASRRLSERVDFLLAGPKSPEMDGVNRLLAEEGLSDRVVYLGKLAALEVAAYQKGAALSVLNKNDNLQNRYGFSTKLATVLLSGTPVITTTVGEANAYLTDGLDAYIVAPHNPDLIAECIVRAFSDPQERLKIGAAGRRLARECFDCYSHGRRLAEFFAGLSAGNHKKTPSAC